MRHKTLHGITAGFFAFACTMHLIRFFVTEWDVHIFSVHFFSLKIPLWVSGLAILVAALFTYFSLHSKDILYHKIAGTFLIFIAFLYVAILANILQIQIDTWIVPLGIKILVGVPMLILLSPLAALHVANGFFNEKHYQLHPPS